MNQEMDFSIDNFKKLELSPNEYVVLYSIITEDFSLQSHLKHLIYVLKLLQ